jgi:glucose-6-phosphate 1-dehydrogenase
MQIWNVIILGITGDLAKLKILPAVAQFSSLYQEKVLINLYGYSRSVANEKEITDLLQKHSRNQEIVLNKIEFKQGDYNNPSFIDELMQNDQESTKTIVYMAVPPAVFVPFLQYSCSYSHKELLILMEKPFGVDKTEAKKLLTNIYQCNLQNKVLFVDHYLFKNSAQIDFSVIQRLLTTDHKPRQIYIRSLEAVSVAGRGGYYDNIGALKDMFVHMYSLQTLVTDLLGIDTQRCVECLEVKDITIGQYDGYLQDVQTDSSNTETYFLSKIQLDEVDIFWETGKHLGIKSTEIEMVFDQGESLLWKISPVEELIWKMGNQEKTLNLSSGKNLDHTNLFKNLLEQDFSHFINEQELLHGWEVYEKLEMIKNFRYLNVPIYQAGDHPIQLV